MSTSSIEWTAGEGGLPSPWMLRLARGLVGEAAAHDVVQEAWAKVGGERPPGYLAAVVRSLARRRHREEGRRAARERRAARPEALPSAAAVAERTEIARRLAEAVERLEEPYRTTLVLRYWDDLSSAEIARRAGLPAATVRARLKRGLDLLRARLDDGEGGRARWVGALAPLARTENASPVATVGALTTALSVKVALGALLAVGGVAALLAVAGRGGAPKAPPVTLVAAEGPETYVEDETPPAVEGRRGSARIEVRGEGAVDPSPATAVAGPPRGRVLARALDESGAPVRDAWLRPRHAPEQTARGDERGELSLDLPPGLLTRLTALGTTGTVEFEVGAPGRRVVHVAFFTPEGAQELQLGELRLPPGGSVYGRVVDEDGLGVEGALVVVGQPVQTPQGIPNNATLRGPPDLNVDAWEDHDPAWTGVSGPGGAFHVGGIGAGYWTVWARTRTSLWAHSEPLGMRSGGEVHEVELVVRDGGQQVITGLVQDPEGQPVPGLELHFSRSEHSGSWWPVHTRTDGTFHFAPLDGAEQTITARAPTLDWNDLVREDVSIGTHDLVLRFARSEWIELAVRDTTGVAVRGGHAEGLRAEGPTSFSLERCSTPLDGSGRGRLRHPGGPLRIRVRAHGCRDLVAGPFDPAQVEQPLVLTLESVPGLIGRVLDAEGRPAAGAVVRLHRGASKAGAMISPESKLDPDAPRYLTHQGWPGDREGFVYRLMIDPLAEVEADEEGRYRLPLPGVDTTARGEVESAHAGLGVLDEATSVPAAESGVTWFVHAALPDRATVTSGPHVLDPTREFELDLRLPARGGAVAGRLALEDGSSPAGWTMRASDALAEIAEAPVAADGSFLFRDLHAGGWQMRAFEPGRRYYPGRMITNRTPEPDVEVVAGETVAYEHRTTRRTNAWLRGRLWVDGAPPGPWRVRVSTTTKYYAIASHELTLDPDGNFELALQPGHSTHVSVVHVAPSGDQLAVVDKPTISPGDNAWSFDFATASLEGFVAPERAVGFVRSSPTYEAEQGSMTVRVSLAVDEAGHFGPVRVPAGPGVLNGPRAGPREGGPVWAELDLEPGEVRAIDLR